jgi:hypothetical protein
MSPEWFKSFGFREFNEGLLKREIFEGCEKSWLQQFNLWRQATFVNCPNVGKYVDYILFVVSFLESDLFIVEYLKFSSPCKQKLVSIFFFS